MSKKISNSISIAVAIALTYLILATAFYVTYYDDNIYEEHFQTAYSTIGVEETYRIFNNLKEYLDKDYFGYNRFELIGNFTEEEKSHYKDVKRIFDWICILYYVAVILMLTALVYIQKKYPKRIKCWISKLLRNSGVASLIIIVLISLASLISFEFAFSIFHIIFFPQGNWMFPMNSLSIILFPGEMFKDFAIRMSIASIIISIVCIVSGAYLKKKK